MNKFEDITVLHIESSDRIDGALSPEVEREIDTVDIVIDGGKVVKNRVCGMGLSQAAGTLKTFKGLSLDPSDALKNISAIMECGYLMTSCSDKECKETGDVAIDFARQYAAAVYTHVLEKLK